MSRTNDSLNFLSSSKTKNFKRQWRIWLIELSVVSDGGQQHKSAHILAISGGRAKKFLVLNHLPTCVPTSEKTISCYCPFNAQVLLCRCPFMHLNLHAKSLHPSAHLLQIYHPILLYVVGSKLLKTTEMFLIFYFIV